MFSTLADSLGRYIIDSLPKGKYNILADLDAEGAYLDSVSLGSSKEGAYPVYVKVRDEAGTVWLDSLGLNGNTRPRFTGEVYLKAPLNTTSAG